MEDMECDSMKQGRLLRIYASKKAIDKKAKRLLSPIHDLLPVIGKYTNTQYTNTGKKAMDKKPR